jgi:hypothetical protein
MAGMAGDASTGDQWITTKEGHKILLGPDGEVKAGAGGSLGGVKLSNAEGGSVGAGGSGGAAGGESSSGSGGLDGFDFDTGELGEAQVISSQEFLDEDIVQRKIDDGDFDVTVSPEFDVDGDKYRVILDGHHSLAAAKESGNKPNFKEASSRDDDKVALLEDGNIEAFLETAYVDSDYRNIGTGQGIW